MDEIQETLRGVVHDAFSMDVEPTVTRTDEQFGDYATNVALQLAGRIGKPPLEVAATLVDRLKVALGNQVKEITVAGPGFINLTLSDEALVKLASNAVSTKPRTYAGQVVVAEYSDPNPFKVLHAGHLYTCIVGDAVANLMENAGGEVHRVNFGGDVGMQVAKSMWGILKVLGGEHPEKLADVNEQERADWLSQRYVEGNDVYQDDSSAKAELAELNKRIYRLHENNDHDSPLAKIYWICRQWSYDYFDTFYNRIGSHFEKYYPESSTTPLALKTVYEQLEKGVYERSDGAIVFRGEQYGLHTRVFINSQGLPTYEAKDVGLVIAKWQDYHFDQSVIITADDISEYMKVVIKSVEQFLPELAKSTTHLTHGIVKLKGGAKMSSRKGNILRAVDVLDAAAQANKEATGSQDEAVVLGAVKYAFLKQRIGADIVYDPQESVSLHGNSGPYLQYAYARAQSILKKSDSPTTGQSTDLETDERSLVRKISEYPEAVAQAVNELMPHYVCTYLYELAQVFNRFYEHNRVIGDPREAVRLRLVQQYADILKNGLTLSGIAAPEHM